MSKRTLWVESLTKEATTYDGGKLPIKKVIRFDDYGNGEIGIERPYYNTTERPQSVTLSDYEIQELIRFSKDKEAPPESHIKMTVLGIEHIEKQAAIDSIDKVLSEARSTIENYRRIIKIHLEDKDYDLVVKVQVQLDEWSKLINYLEKIKRDLSVEISDQKVKK